MTETLPKLSREYAAIDPKTLPQGRWVLASDMAFAAGYVVNKTNQSKQFNALREAGRITPEMYILLPSGHYLYEFDKMLAMFRFLGVEDGSPSRKKRMLERARAGLTDKISARAIIGLKKTRKPRKTADVKVPSSAPELGSTETEPVENVKGETMLPAPNSFLSDISELHIDISDCSDGEGTYDYGMVKNKINSMRQGVAYRKERGELVERRVVLAALRRVSEPLTTALSTLPKRMSARITASVKSEISKRLPAKVSISDVAPDAVIEQTIVAELKTETASLLQTMRSIVDDTDSALTGLKDTPLDDKGKVINNTKGEVARKRGRKLKGAGRPYTKE